MTGNNTHDKGRSQSKTVNLNILWIYTVSCASEWKLAMASDTTSGYYLWYIFGSSFIAQKSLHNIFEDLSLKHDWTSAIYDEAKKYILYLHTLIDDPCLRPQNTLLLVDLNNHSFNITPPIIQIWSDPKSNQCMHPWWYHWNTARNFRNNSVHRYTRSSSQSKLTKPH